MTGRERFLIGGAGALAPTVLNLLTIDFVTVFAHLTWLAFLGYIVRTAVYFLLGGFWTAFLHKSEKNPRRLFQLGIVAPALLAAAVNGTAASRSAILQPASAIYEVAGEKPQPCVEAGAVVRTFPAPKETPAQQITRGLVGARPKQVVFVVASFHPTLEDANRQAQRVVRVGAGPMAEVYCSPDRWQPSFPFAVVIGANLNLQEAERIRDRAIAAGIVTAILVDVTSR